MKHTKSFQLGEAELTIESGQIAKQANGSCLVKCGETVVLTTACMSGDPTAPRPFLPLTVDYREYSYAAGRIPGGFFKREGRPSEKEILTCRMTDRPLRPLVPDGYFGETQIITFVLSAGALIESKLLGGQAVIVIADEVETAFTVGQNWPLGSALAGRALGSHPARTVAIASLAVCAASLAAAGLWTLATPGLLTAMSLATAGATEPTARAATGSTPTPPAVP